VLNTLTAIQRRVEGGAMASKRSLGGENLSEWFQRGYISLKLYIGGTSVPMLLRHETGFLRGVPLSKRYE
jgi:hypothetical protein